MGHIDALLDELADRIAARLDERQRAGRPGWVSQAKSPLGSRRHCRAVNRRLEAGEAGAHAIGRQRLLSPQALSEELARASKRELPVAVDPGNVRAELEHQDGRPVAAQCVVDACCASGRDLARDARVDDAIIGPALLQPLVEQAHPAVLLADSIRR